MPGTFGPRPGARPRVTCLVMGAAPRGRRNGGGSIETATFTQPPSHDHEFQVLFAAPGPGAGPAARTVLERLADRGLHVVPARTAGGLRSTIAVHGRAAAAAAPTSAIPIGAAVLSWELFESPGELAAVIDEIQKLSAPPPVVVVSEQVRE